MEKFFEAKTNKTVLLFEENEVVSYLLKLYLERNQIRCIPFKVVSKAGELKVSQGRVDLILYNAAFFHGDDFKILDIFNHSVKRFSYDSDHLMHIGMFYQMVENALNEAPIGSQQYSFKSLQNVYKRMNSDISILKNILDQFILTTHQELEKIRININEKNYGEIKVSAHSLKGCFFLLDAKKGVELAIEMEIASEKMEEACIEKIFSSIVDEIGQIIKVLTDFCDLN